MRHAEEVTFGGSGLDRAAELRERPGALAEALAHPRARAVVLWRGKPLISDENGGTLVRVPLEHPLLRDGSADRLLLGREDGAPVVAVDLAGWEPADGTPGTLGGFSDTTEQVHPALPEAWFADLRRVMTRLCPRDAELAATARALFGWHAIHGFCARCGAPTEVALAGWQRVCPVCAARHFPRTDPVVIMLITHGNSVLLGRSPGWPEGMFSCLAGFVEPGETLEAAVRRETFEEAGVHVGEVGYLASQPWPFPASLMIGCHGAATSTEITVDPAEIEEALWLTREELADAFGGTHPRVTPARGGAIARFLLRNWLADRLD